MVGERVGARAFLEVVGRLAYSVPVTPVTHTRLPAIPSLLAMTRVQLATGSTC